MLTPDYLQNCTERIQRIAQEYEDAIIAAIVTAIVLGGTPDIDPILYDFRRAGEKEIKRAITEGARQSIDPTKMPNPTFLQRLLNHVARTTLLRWRNMTATVAYEGEREYVDAADRAYKATLEGMQARDAAVRKEVNRLGSEGITFVENKRRDHVDVAMARNLRTSIAQTAGDIVLQSAKEHGIDKVLVSAHLGARPTHEVWQGKVYSLTGKTSEYEDFYEATGYGTIEGLCGVNCRHTFTAYVDGMKNPFEDINKAESRKRYAVEQKMREMERNIRAQKRKLVAVQASGDTEATRDERHKLTAMNKEYRAFCAAHGMRPLDERLKV